MDRRDAINSIINMLLVFIISLIFFWIIDIPYKLFSVIAICISAVIFIKFQKNNHSILKLTSIIILSATVGFFAKNCLSGAEVEIDILDKIFALVNSVIIIGFFISGVKQKKTAKGKQKNLMEPQKYDVIRIQEYLEAFDLIGINGAWGTGKTFLSDFLQSQKEMCSKYLFINVDLLSCNLDKIHLVIFNLLEKNLNNHYIYSENSKQIKKLLSEIKVLSNLFSFMHQEETSYSEAVKNFQSELKYLDKTIVIIFEDIDRISSADKIKEIFSISERLVCDSIKIVYHYDESKLEELKFNHEYIEKYIPYVVNLTPIKFTTAVKHLMNEYFYDAKILTVKDFEFLTIPKSIFWDKINFSLSFDLYGVSIRKIYHFLSEIINSIKNNPEYQKNDNKKVVIVFYLIKHLFNDVYKKISVADSLINTLTLSFEDKEYTVIELLNYLKENKRFNDETVKSIFHLITNRNHMLMLSLLGYDFDVYSVVIENKVNDFYNEKTGYTKNLNTNYKIDRLVWNLLCNGKSEYTNSENAVRKFIQEVLNKDKAQQKKAFMDFNRDMFEQNLYKDDNETIFKLALNDWFSIFRAFYVSDVDRGTWIKLIDFYFDFSGVKEIDQNAVATLRFCNISSNMVYIHVLERFNKLSVAGNMNDKKYNKSFLIEYLRNLSSLSYINTFALEMLETRSDTPINPEIANMAFDELKKELVLLKEKIAIDEITRDIDIILEFINKNKSVIDCKNTLKEKGFLQNSKVSSRYIHQEEFDRLLKLKGTESFEKETIESYKNDKIGVHEISDLSQ